MRKPTCLREKLQASLPEISVKFVEPMAKHTSLRIGGGAEAMAFPKNPEELAALWRFCDAEGIAPRILGAGTNILAPDEGIPGLVICLKDCLDGIARLDGNRIRVMAGVTMTRAAVFAVGLGLSGMEFAHGIPGTVGGGVYMNAGAYGGEIKDICESVEILNGDGTLATRSAEVMGFSYRHSAWQEQPGIVVSAVFCLKPADPAQIRREMRRLMEKRAASQPLDLPSAGSAFKRPASGYAAALIDQAGLRGFRVGDAAISQKHTGFAVNLGSATAADMKELLRQVSDRVYEDSGIRLEPEVRIW